MDEEIKERRAYGSLLNQILFIPISPRSVILNLFHQFRGRGRGRGAYRLLFVHHGEENLQFSIVQVTSKHIFDIREYLLDLLLGHISTFDNI